jgi:hypothetical protein
MSDKVYGIASVYSFVSPFFMREYPGEEQELVLRYKRILAYATPILWSLCTAYLIISGPVYAWSL